MQRKAKVKGEGEGRKRYSMIRMDHPGGHEASKSERDSSPVQITPLGSSVAVGERERMVNDDNKKTRMRLGRDGCGGIVQDGGERETGCLEGQSRLRDEMPIVFVIEGLKLKGVWAARRSAGELVLRK